MPQKNSMQDYSKWSLFKDWFFMEIRKREVYYTFLHSTSLTLLENSWFYKVTEEYVWNLDADFIYLKKICKQIKILKLKHLGLAVD